MPDPAEARQEADLELVRVSVRDDGAFGVVLVLGVPKGQPGMPLAVACERTYPLPDAPNAQLLKIPAGVHLCVRDYFHRGRHETFEVQVPSHDRLLWHKGNVEDDSEGCILVGRRFGLVAGHPAVLDSAGGFADFMRWAGRRADFRLLVTGGG